MSARFEIPNSRPFRARDFFPGVGGGHGSAVPFNRSIADRINKLYMSSPVVSTAVNQFVTYVTRSELKIEGGKISSEQLEREILPAIGVMVLEWVLYGYTNVCAGKSRTSPGRPTLVVVPHLFVQQTMEWDDNWQIKYTVQSVGNATVGDASKIRVLCAYPPDSRGLLTSPVAQCVTHLGYAEHLWTTYITGSERSVNPVYVFTQERKGASTLPGIDSMPLNASLFTRQGLGQAPLDQVIQTAEEDATEYTEKVLEAARKQRATALAIQKTEREQVKAASSGEYAIDTEQVLPGTLRAQLASDPMDNLYVAPPGHTVTSGPEFKTPSEFTRVIDLIAEELYRALGLPIIMLQSRADTSSNVEFANNVLNENVVQFQKRISPLIAEALDLVFSEELQRESINQALAKDVISIASADEPIVDDREEIELPPLPRFGIEFINNPITSFELIDQMFRAGFITAEAAQELALSIFNLPKSAKRPRMEEWLKAQRESGAEKKPRR